MTNKTSGTAFIKVGARCIDGSGSDLIQFFNYVKGVCLMATTGELRAIMQELELVDIGDAASYLGEEATIVEEASVSVQPVLVTVTNSMHLATCNDSSCDCVTVS
jgi:hypothetical protein